MSSPAHDLPSLYVLLIEDPATRSPILEMLEDTGHLVTVWDDRGETLPDGDFDLALANLPAVRLPDVSRVIRALDQSSGTRLPLLAVAPPGTSGIAGCVGVISDPPTPKTLTEALARAIGRDGEVPVVDERHLDQLRQSLDPAMLKQLLDTACRSIDETLVQIDAMRTDGDGHGLARAAHRLVGVAANFGCQALARLAETLEKSGPATIVPWSDLATLAATTTAELRAQAQSSAQAG